MMGNAHSKREPRDRAGRTTSSGAGWVIPLNRTKLPVARPGGPARHARPRLYRRPSLRTWNESNNDNDAPPTWENVRRYLLHGPAPSKRHRRR